MSDVGSVGSIPNTPTPVTNYQYFQPLTGGSVSPNQGTINSIINPAGSLASLTFNFAASPLDGDICTISTSQTITILTMSASPNTISGALTSMPASTFATYVFVAAASMWFRTA